MRSRLLIPLLVTSFALAHHLSAQVVQPGDVIVVSEADLPDTLRVYDGCSGALKAQFQDASWEYSGAGRYVEVAPDGSIWVSDTATRRIYRYDANLNPKPLYAGGPAYVDVASSSCSVTNVLGFTFSPNGSMHGVTAGPSLVYAMDTATGLGTSCTATSFQGWDVGWLPGGTLCVSSADQAGVRIIDPNSGAVSQTIDCGGSLTIGWSVDALSNGNIVLAENHAQRIVVVDPAQPSGGQCVLSIPTGATDYPWILGLDVDEARGRIYASVFRSGKYWLDQYDLATGARILWTEMTAASPTWYPFALAVVPSGGTCACISNYCTAGTTVHGCVPAISGLGTPSATASSGFVIAVNSTEGQRNGLIFYGFYQQVTPWGPAANTSYKCIANPVQRTDLLNSGGTSGQCDGLLQIDFNAWLQTNPLALGSPFVPGQVFNAQGWFRDPAAPGGTNMSDALHFTLCN